MTRETQRRAASSRLAPLGRDHATERRRDWLAIAALSAALAWQLFFLVVPEAYDRASVPVGPGLLSAFDLYLIPLFIYALAVALFPSPHVARSVIRYLRILFVSLLWLVALGLFWGNASKDIVGDWKHVAGLFGGAGLALLLRQSRFSATQLSAVSFGLVPLLASAVMIAKGIAISDEFRHLGSHGLYVVAQVCVPWLGVILSWWLRQGAARLAVLAAALAAITVIPGLATRALAVGVATVAIGAIALLPVLSRRRAADGVTSHRRQSQKAMAPTGGRPYLRAAIAAAMVLVAVVGLLVVDARRYETFAGGFLDRFSADNTQARDNVSIRLDELAEMRESMNDEQVLLGRGLGATYYFSVADSIWVPWGLYSTPMLPAPHILIAWLYLKGGWPFFAMFGVVVPLLIVRTLVVNAIKGARQYLEQVAPLDLGILAMFAMLYSSVHYDPLPLMSLSLAGTLKLLSADDLRAKAATSERRAPARDERAEISAGTRETDFGWDVFPEGTSEVA